ncbi:hypothetical protein COV93_01185 [Candidatus Woesearchaeota archaeon CG11_big_fil_rev_8_21_14_0_20_43_8]|nr:MAG: hypothetical protein COV93_01185 [Candidatus Woesearchaeota archaeon CG11_big_fil_rev_8_21_14_0_20_43_8]PIO05624.1 MAG: hypothetical protein COT47_03950 [Candidatus Woesearchaeota archaeon CG08_land_8_20_14_0_20_43_7]
MGGERSICMIGILLLFPILVSAATISGTVYDINLDPLDDVVVEINTTPNQKMVSRAGTYSFTAPVGSYMIKASHVEAGQIDTYAVENITVESDGDFILDMFTFPDFSENERLFDDGIVIDDTLLEGSSKSDLPLIFVLLGSSILVFVVAFIVLSKKKRSDLGDDCSQELVSILKKNGGRMTQKEIRKEIPLSESKISLMITDLESQGRLKKIKKGRGNVVILTK